MQRNCKINQKINLPNHILSMLVNLLFTIRYGPSLRSGPNVQNIEDDTFNEQFRKPSYPDKLLVHFVSTIQWKWTRNNSKFSCIDKKTVRKTSLAQITFGNSFLRTKQTYNVSLRKSVIEQVERCTRFTNVCRSIRCFSERWNE